MFIYFYYDDVLEVKEMKFKNLSEALKQGIADIENNSAYPIKIVFSYYSGIEQLYYDHEEIVNKWSESHLGGLL
jgi:hypothetical protein